MLPYAICIAYIVIWTVINQLMLYYVRSIKLYYKIIPYLISCVHETVESTGIYKSNGHTYGLLTGLSTISIIHIKIDRNDDNEATYKEYKQREIC